MMMTFYKFSDGYFVWTCGKMNRAEKKNEVKKHGKIIEEKTKKF